MRPALIALVLGAAVTAAAGSTGPTTIVLLGTGTPRPDPAAHGPATAILVGDRVFVVDAGEGIERQLAAAKLPISGVTALFITHLHSDHTLGYPDLILTSWVMERQGALLVYGPPGLRRMTDRILDAWREDIDMRAHGLEHRLRENLPVDVHEIRPGVVYDRDGVRVTAIRVEHGSWKEAFGYRFDTPGRSITLSGDTRPSESLVAAARGTDVLIHEGYPTAIAAPQNRPGGELWPQYMREFHTSAVELGALAARIQPKLLIVDHVVRRGADDELIGEVRKGGFQGRVVVGNDLDRY